MAAPKSKSGVRRGTTLLAKKAGKTVMAKTAFFIGPDQDLFKATSRFRMEVSDVASKALTRSPKQMKALLKVYSDAIVRSRTVGRPVSFRVEVDPKGETFLSQVDDVAVVRQPVAEEVLEPDPELEASLADARERGRLRAADILGGADMLSADAFAKMLGTTRVTVNTKRRSGQVLGLDGAKRGFRFPAWQLDAEGKPYAALRELHERLGGPWAVYRFLVQPHGELDGFTGREALERGNVRAALEAAWSVGRDFR